MNALEIVVLILVLLVPFYTLKNYREASAGKGFQLFYVVASIALVVVYVGFLMLSHT